MAVQNRKPLKKTCLLTVSKLISEPCSEILEAKILHKVKGTGACRHSEINNMKVSYCKFGSLTNTVSSWSCGTDCDTQLMKAVKIL